jgi:hypothetical protein
MVRQQTDVQEIFGKTEGNIMTKKEIIHSPYLGYNQARVGGYSTIEDEGKTRGMADFVDHEDVIKIAKKNHIKSIYLAGDWSRLGHKGYGELVPVKVAERLSKKLKEVM